MTKSWSLLLTGSMLGALGCSSDVAEPSTMGTPTNMQPTAPGENPFSDPSQGGTATASGGGTSTAAAGMGGDTSAAGGTPAMGGSGGETTIPDDGCPGVACLDFEMQNFAGWIPMAQGGPAAEIGTEQVHGGTYAMHLANPTCESGGSNCKSWILRRLNNFGGVMWGRMWLYLATGAPANHGGVVKAFGPLVCPECTNIQTDWYEVGFQGGNYLGNWHQADNTGAPMEKTSSSSVPYASGTWQCVEWQFDGAASADPQIFVDGTQVAYDNVGATPAVRAIDSFSSVTIGFTMYHDTAGPADMWVDDIVIATERVGCE
jgi:hypothetical protein